MALYASRILKLATDRFRDPSVLEVRFVAGRHPAFVNREGPHFLDLGRLSSERVGEIHELCRLVADDPVEEFSHWSAYTFVLRHVGRVHCRFQREGNAASLVVVRDSLAEETIAAIRRRPSPALRAEAKPESNE